MTIVIADDITGAAEMAGIALGYGLKTIMVTKPSRMIPKVDALIIALNTRSYSCKEATEQIQEVASLLKGSQAQIFKKTDSVLRGHIVAELQTLIDSLNFDCALLLPENPSKNRIIRFGDYFVEEVPLSKTLFKDDPEFPAHSSNVIALLEEKAVYLGVKDSLKTDKSIQIAEATSLQEVKLQLEKADKKHVLLAGGADLFSAYLNKSYQKRTNKKPTLPKTSSALFFCGSTQSKPLSSESYILDLQAKEFIMPDEVFNGAIELPWFSKVKESYSLNPYVIVSIGKRENKGKLFAIRLREIMAKLSLELVKIKKPELFIIEGGATAFSILEKLDWNTFEIKQEYAPGVVGMLYGGTEIILKPGSYPWGNLFS
ncbi:MAG: hypothetical protein LUC37_06420 [Prevotella sp.]|nr:hypothetical protein [Prevotella sp.]